MRAPWDEYDGKLPELLSATRRNLEPLFRKLIAESCTNVEFVNGTVVSFVTGADGSISEVAARVEDGSTVSYPCALVAGESALLEAVVANIVCRLYGLVAGRLEAPLARRAFSSDRPSRGLRSGHGVHDARVPASTQLRRRSSRAQDPVSFGARVVRHRQLPQLLRVQPGPEGRQPLSRRNAA